MKMTENLTPLKRANRLFATGKYSDALTAYQTAKEHYPALADIIDANIDRALKMQNKRISGQKNDIAVSFKFASLTPENLSQDCVLQDGWLISRQDRSTPGIKFDLHETQSAITQVNFIGLEASVSHLNVFMLNEDGKVISRKDLSVPSFDKNPSLTFGGNEIPHSLFITFKNPNIGDRLRFKELNVEFPKKISRSPAIIGLRSKVAVGIASIPARERSLIQVVSTLAQQADEVHVFLNQYERVPRFLEGKPEIRVYTSQEYDDHGDVGKFFGLKKSQADLCLTIDDDIIYPEDYVDRLSKAAQKYRLPVGVHGSLLRFPSQGYYSPSARTVFHFSDKNEFDRRVHILGTGTLCFDRNLLDKLANFNYRNMADIWFAKYCSQLNLGQICLERESNWLNATEDNGNSIYSKNHNILSTQNIIVNSEVRNSAGLFIKSKISLPKISIGIKTFNRLPYLKECIESLIQTIDSEFDTVIIVADDGSTDGTKEYLAELNIPFELHVIGNERTYVSGQANSIIALALEVRSDFIIVIDDDLYFKRRGWMREYYSAAMESGYHHLCHFNLPHYEQLTVQRGEEFPPSAREHSEHNLIAYSTVELCMGALFTLTPEVIEKVGWADEVNFFVRGLWHVDYSTRCCRAGFNEAQRFFDIKNANDYLELQNTRNEAYATSIAWNSNDFKRASEPEERARRRELIAERTRIFLSKLDAQSGRLIKREEIYERPYKVNSFFDRVFVINLDRRPDRLQAVNAKLQQLGIVFERFPAVDGTDPDVRKEYEDYRQSRPSNYSMNRTLNSREFNQGEKSDIERVASLEKTLDGPAIRTAGAWAYSKTYEKILRRCLTDRLTRVLVLDDDACFHKDFINLFDSAVRELPSDWKIFQLGTMQYDWAHTRAYSDHLYLPDGVVVASHAVGFHIDTIPTMLDSIDRWSLPFDIGPLHYACRQFREKSFVALPNLIIQDQSESDISSSDVAHSESKKKSNIYRWITEDYS